MYEQKNQGMIRVKELIQNKSKNFKNLMIPIFFAIIVSQLFSSFENLENIKIIIEIIVIPIFIFLLAREIKDMTYEKQLNIAKLCLVGYAIVQIISYFLAIHNVIGEPGKIDIWNFLEPVRNNWILLAIPIWIMITPIITKFKHSILIVIFLEMIFYLCLLSTNILGLDKIASLYLFFLLGFIIKDKKLEKLLNKKWLIIVNLILTLLFICWLNIKTSLFIFPEATFSLENKTLLIFILITRCILLYLTISSALVLLMLSPQQKNFNKIPIKRYITFFVLLGFMVWLLEASHLQNLAHFGFLGIVSIFIFAILINIFLYLLPIRFLRDKYIKLCKICKKRGKSLKLSIIKENKMSFKSLINYIVNSKLIVFIFSIAILLKSIFFYKATIALNDHINPFTIVGTIGFISILAAIILWIPNRARFWTCLIINFGISFLLLIDELYFIYSNNALSIAQFSNLQYSEEIGRVLPTLLHWKHLIYFTDIVVVLILYFFKIIKLEKKKQDYIFSFLYTILILIFFPLSIMEHIYIGLNTQYDKAGQIDQASIFGYHIVDIWNVKNVKKTAKYATTNEAMNAYIQLKDDYNKRYDDDKTKDGISKNKNIIVLQLESLQNFLVDRTINGKEITPNLNKFLHENIMFTNMHAQSYTSTADSEFSVMNSLYPLENGTSFSQYYANTYDDMYTMLKKGGYDTFFMHGNNGAFWNRRNVYSRAGINTLWFEEEKKESREYISDYLADETLYIEGVEELKRLEQPFLASIVSASSHTPFDLKGIQNKEQKVTIDVGKYKNTYFGDYLEAANYTDYAFGVFIEKLKQENLYNDTTILLFGDHYGITMYDNELQDFLGTTNNVKLQLNFTNVLCGLKIANFHNITITKPVSKIDIKPTLAQICGVKDGVSLGMSMFSNKDFVCLNNEKIITEKYYYNTGWYDIQTGEKINEEMLDEETKKQLETYYQNMKQEIDISFSIGIHDLLK